MDYKTRYQKRLNKKGIDSVDALIYNTKQAYNNSFTTSPSYISLTINGVSNEGNIIETKSSTEKIVAFRPDTTINIGNLVNIESKDYLIIEMKDVDLFPSAEIQFCNTTFPLTSSTKTLAGYDDFGKPVYSETESTSYIPCIAEKVAYIGTYDLKQPVNLPDNKIIITIQYTEHDDIKINNEFKLQDQDYKITMVDKTKSDTVNKTGLIVIHAETVVN